VTTIADSARVQPAGAEAKGGGAINRPQPPIDEELDARHARRLSHHHPPWHRTSQDRSGADARRGEDGPLSTGAVRPRCDPRHGDAEQEHERADDLARNGHDHLDRPA
jgi:hypothetical protein